MKVTSVAADRIRSLDGVKLEMGGRVTAIVGANGAGKTNLIEAVYFGLTGRSFRTGDRRDLIPFGSPWARSQVVTESDDGSRHEFMAAVSRSEGARFKIDGSTVDRVQAVNYRPMLTVFSPDRLEIVKGPPAGRRAHLDAWIAARWPGRSEARSAFGRALAQRNALLSAVVAGRADKSQLRTWNSQVARSGAELCRLRKEAVGELSDHYTRFSAELGLEGENALIFKPGSTDDPAELEKGLEERLDADLRTGRTTWGPHHDELRLEMNGRQLRRFGSQGQQRLGLLALFFAERGALLDGGAPAPLMLLDDVMSELDSRRRELLVERLLEGGQSVITAAEGNLIPEREGLALVPIRDLLDSDSDGSADVGAEEG